MLIEVLLDALKDSVIILPFLFIVYVIIEIIEQKYMFGVRIKKILKGKMAPVIGAGVGLIPQCGFSVMATNLYLTKNITLGTLIAVYIATSDEAIPIMLSNFESAMDLLPILGIKLAFAIIVGYITDLITRKYQIKNYKIYIEKLALHNEDEDYEDNDTHSENHSDEIIGCCNHKIKVDDNKKLGNAQWAKTFLFHPLIHSLKIFGFILIINIIFGIVIESIGEVRLMAFLSQMSWYQPFLVGLVGLIPNCAASVIITQMYVLGGINMGACITGLCVNSGIAVAVLFSKSENKLGCLLLIFCIYLASCLLGLGLTFLSI